MEENQQKTSENQVIRNEKGQVIAGTPNPNGRPKGTKNFSTLFKEAVKSIADDTGTDVEKELVKRAIAEALDGKYQYFKDIHDRVYGQATQKIEEESTRDITFKWNDSNND